MSFSALRSKVWSLRHAAASFAIRKPAASGNAGFFAAAIENIADLIVPTLSLYEVFKNIIQQRSESGALQAVAVMQQGRVTDLDSRTALHAARLSLDLRLPMADSVMLATAREHDSILWTQDPHFDGLRGGKYRESGR